MFNKSPLFEVLLRKGGSRYNGLQVLIAIGTIKHKRKVAEVLTMDKQKTGNLIKEARVKKNYTQGELGDLLGVSNKAVSRWENGVSQT